jgi:uncharacterized membrane protein
LNAESKFERIIAYILISGVMMSLLLEVAGIILFHHSHGDFKILEDKGEFIHGRNFFHFLIGLVRGEYAHGKPIFLMTLGIAILMLTPYVRVILSVLFFSKEKNIKYVVITLFVLALLTISLMIR